MYVCLYICIYVCMCAICMYSDYLTKTKLHIGLVQPKSENKKDTEYTETTPTIAFDPSNSLVRPPRLEGAQARFGPLTKLACAPSKWEAVVRPPTLEGAQARLVP